MALAWRLVRLTRALPSPVVSQSRQHPLSGSRGASAEVLPVILRQSRRHAVVLVVGATIRATMAMAMILVTGMVQAMGAVMHRVCCLGVAGDMLWSSF